ncbi:MarR family winged helix-turn-helix transcriptional regulator [Oerskovia flava]|uniref:MarR family winged helix-turn-helix transcriptional regulator n=1 Tax=Oerskovia flava TaxID=2986422 RepID=UPI002240C0E1|nr:MarR family transcriptional regulator [Oerskovia sp. JB1-3-2]
MSIAHPTDPTLDDVDLIQEEWARERPDLPLRSIGVLTRIRRIAKVLEDDRRRTMAALGMDPAIRDLLATLRRSGPPYRLRASELADRCRVSRGAITQRVDRAEGDGLVRRVPGGDPAAGQGAGSGGLPGGRLAVWVELTPAGRELVERTVEQLLAHEDDLVAGLDDEEIVALSRTLRRFLRLLDGEPPGRADPQG